MIEREKIHGAFFLYELLHHSHFSPSPPPPPPPPPTTTTTTTSSFNHSWAAIAASSTRAYLELRLQAVHVALVRRQELPRRVAVGQELGPLAAEELHLDLQGPRLGRRLLRFGPRRRRLGLEPGRLRPRGLSRPLLHRQPLLALGVELLLQLPQVRVEAQVRLGRSTS